MPNRVLDAADKQAGTLNLSKNQFIWQTMKPLYRTNDIVTSLCDDSCNLR
jgi:hypothetical protein